jgi:hypothetical protein
MQDLLRRIWRYLNYPPATHGKVEEIGQQVRKLSEGLPQVQKLVTDVEKFKVKIATVESDIRYLKTLAIAVQNQLNSIQDHLRSSQAWLPSQPGLLEKPESLLLAHLIGFLQDPSSVLRIIDGGFGPAAVRQIATLRPEIVEIALVAPLERPLEEKPGNLVWPSEDSVRDMRAQGYRWSLLLFEIKGEQAVRFAVNPIALPDAALGSFFFFKDSRLFDEAYRWSQTLLPRFQHRPGLQN